MDTISHHNEQEFLIFESQLRENYGKIIYTHKTQEKCADILTIRNNRIKNLQITLSAIITTGIFIKLFQGQQWALITSMVVSTVQLGLTAFLKEYNLGEAIQKHRAVAFDLWKVREEYFSLITDFKSNTILIEDARVIRNKLLEKLSKANSNSPRTFNKAYEQARKALQLNEELTFDEKEIDKFLPAELRRH